MNWNGPRDGMGSIPVRNKNKDILFPIHCILNLQKTNKPHSPGNESSPFTETTNRYGQVVLFGISNEMTVITL